MQVEGTSYRTIWLDKDQSSVSFIDQTQLPHRFTIKTMRTAEDCATAISTMQVRGAPLIGAAGAYGVFLAMQEAATDQAIDRAYQQLLNTRPTAVNLRIALDRITKKLKNTPIQARVDTARTEAEAIADEDVEQNHQLGQYAAMLFEQLSSHKANHQPLNILTHCNAGWLATVDWGTALSGVFQFHRKGFPVHVWVDETRPRNQGASLTAWELQQEGIPHTVIADNVGGHLMQHGQVDCCIVGTDRTTASGDVCNKIGTYLKALAAHDNCIPFYVAAPSTSIDWTLENGLADIPIEERSAQEVSHITGKDATGQMTSVQLVPDQTVCINYGFDVTPAKYITSLITERGICFATKEGLRQLFTTQSQEEFNAKSL